MTSKASSGRTLPKLSMRLTMSMFTSPKTKDTQMSMGNTVSSRK